MTSVLTYADVKRPLANRNEIKGIAKTLKLVTVTTC